MTQQEYITRMQNSNSNWAEITEYAKEVRLEDPKL